MFLLSLLGQLHSLVRKCRCVKGDFWKLSKMFQVEARSSSTATVTKELWDCLTGILKVPGDRIVLPSLLLPTVVDKYFTLDKVEPAVYVGGL